MRRRLAACRSGIALAAAAVVSLTGCGGSDEEERATPTTSGSSSVQASPTGASSSAPASTTSASPAGSEFCRGAAAVQQQVATTFGGGSDPATLPTVLQQAVEDIRALEPPAELASDWSAFADGIEDVAVAARIDFDDPAARAAFQQRVGEVQQEHGPAFARVQAYLGGECGLAAPAQPPQPPR